MSQALGNFEYGGVPVGDVASPISRPLAKDRGGVLLMPSEATDLCSRLMVALLLTVTNKILLMI